MARGVGDVKGLASTGATDVAFASGILTSVFTGVDAGSAFFFSTGRDGSRDSGALEDSVTRGLADAADGGLASGLGATVAASVFDTSTADFCVIWEGATFPTGWDVGACSTGFSGCFTSELFLATGSTSAVFGFAADSLGVAATLGSKALCDGSTGSLIFSTGFCAISDVFDEASFSGATPATLAGAAFR